MRKRSKSGVSCFTRWSRKNYGVFASLGKTVKIGVLSFTMSILTLNAKGVAAQPDTLRMAEEIEALQVTAERLNPTRGIIAPVEVYRRDTLATASTQTIESVLRLNPAVDVRERGGKGVQADISLRGGTYDQTMVLLNGIDFTDARTGHQSHSLPVDMDIVGSIDIISGLTGIGAYSGAVNIITTPLYADYLRAEIAGGAYGYLYSNLSGAATKNGLTVMAAGSIRRSDGYMENTDFDNTNLFTRITYQSSGAGLFDMQAGYQRRDFGANGFYSLAYPDQFEHTETGLASIRWQMDIGRLRLKASASYRKNNDRYELYRSGKGAPEGWVPNYHTTDNAGATVEGEYRWIAGTTSAGLDYKYQHIYSNVLGEPLTVPIKVPGHDALYTHAKTRNVVNGWLSHSVQLGGTSLAASANVAGSPYGTFVSWSASAGQRLTAHWSVEAGATRSMRLPTFTDLYYTNATHVGNPDLKPEQATTYQLSTQFARGNFSALATGFFRHGRNVIDYVLADTSEGEKWHSTQLTQLDTYGLELQASYRGRRILRHITASYGWLSSTKDASDRVTRYALDYMRHKAAVQCGIDIWRGFVLDITASWYDRNDTPEAAYAPYWLLDARLSWNKRMLTIYIEATNLLNTEYYDFVGLRQAPRWLTAGVAMTIH